MSAPRISIPHRFFPRSHQLNCMAAMDAGCKRAMTVHHRRAGKDKMWLNIMIKKMVQRVGAYFYFFPTYVQGRKVIWNGMDDSGMRFLDHFPSELVDDVNETEMRVRLKNGSLFQINGTEKMGTDKDRIVGTNPVGVVFSEYPLQNPLAWRLISPILNANGGWAGFAFTPRGRNHAYDLWNAVRNEPSWFTELLTVEHTSKDAKALDGSYMPGEDGGPIVSEQQIQLERRTGTKEEIIQQEYYCSFSGFLHGTIYGDLMQAAREDGRIARFPHFVNMPVGTVWDIGRTDETAIWFYQVVNDWITFIDYIEDRLKGAHDYAQILTGQKPYLYGRTVLPHDSRIKGYSATQSTEEYLASVLPNVVVAQRVQPLQLKIDATRRTFSRFRFDIDKCARGIKCLEEYARPWNEELQAFSGDPIHNEFSHGATAVETGVIGGFEPLGFPYAQEREAVIVSDFDPMEGYR